MKWPAHAFTAAIQRLTDFGTRVSTTDCQPTSADTSGTAQNTPERPCSDVTRLLERRALVVGNRNRKAAQAYLDRHQALIRGR